MKTIKFEKLNIEIEIKTDEASLFEIKELRDRIRVFFEDKKILVIHRNSRVRLCNFAHVICYAGRVVAFNDVLVEARGAARAEARGTSRVEAFDRAYVTAYDKSYVAGFNRSTIRAYDTSGVMGCDECVIRAYDTSAVTGFDSSFILARDNVNCLLFQGAEVRASGHAKVRALDSSRVTARGYAQVDLEGRSIGYKKPFSRAKINVLDNRAAVFES
ncbi:MAG: hypothetical protein GX638_19050 [Crenarchaeota archaeon]|nr:hypothetical protein [Thermoproteota archaeon]